MRSLVTTMAMILGTCSPLAGAAKEAAAAKSFQIDVAIYQTAADGTRKCLSNPSLITLEGRPATCLTGAELPAPTGTKGLDYVEFGTRVQVQVYEIGNGKVTLDATVELTDVVESGGNGKKLRLAGKRLRTIEVVRLGRTIELPIEENDDGSEKYVEITVRPMPKEERAAR